jgi:uncharacterized protein (DUF2062 family)
MPRRLIKRYLPDAGLFHSHATLRHFGERLHDPNLWHLNRGSVSGAVAAGVFIAFIPVPFQMVIAAAAAILFRINLPVSVVMVWISNPLTIPPIFYATYKFGAWLLSVHPKPASFELSFAWLVGEMVDIWKPLLLGSLLVGTACAILSYVLVRLVWRWHVIINYRKRRRTKRERAVGGGAARTPAGARPATALSGEALPAARLESRSFMELENNYRVTPETASRRGRPVGSGPHETS